MARLVWRKNNLLTFRVAELAQNRYSAIESERPNLIAAIEAFRKARDTFDQKYDPEKAAKSREAEKESRKERLRMDAKAREDAEEQARQELGDPYGLTQMGDLATIDQLMKDLAVEERLDALVDKCLKRLLFVRGLKSISSSSSSAPRPLIQGPSKAARDGQALKQIA